MLTLIPQSHIDIIICQTAKAIRDFLSEANPSVFEDEAALAIALFKSNPNHFTDTRLLAYGKNMSSATNHPVRIELRGLTNKGVAQIVAKGVWGVKRIEIAHQIMEECRKHKMNVDLRLAGTSSMEFSVMGVDKSLPLRFLEGYFSAVLDQMQYQPGKYIDSRQSKIVIAADGDGTIYDGPLMGSLPTLAQSPVKEALHAYLRAGGVFILISGNHLERSFKRLVDGLPKDVYCRVLVAGNGGSEMVYVNAHGQPKAIKEYKEQALVLTQSRLSVQDLDMYYIGDDGALEGNDYAAFRAVGFDRSILVAPVFFKNYDQGLKAGYYGQGIEGTARFLNDFLKNRFQI